ncbi:hypothetical protein [Horticoccus sp. 23ND18S-11]|uniref:hypothetical protein n=1 Tax=Horticoccus sp. 23ND18S-11 TaxID=3391832 RepID=UPI0039C94BA2
MSRADYYTPDAILTEMRADLEPWVRAKKGELSIARDPFHFLELLAESPASFRVVLHWDGESNPGDEPQAGVFAAQKISLGVTANLGLTAKPDEALHKATANRAALLRLLADVRDRARSYVWPDETTARYMLYKSADVIVLPDSGLPLAGYRLNFELTIALPPVEYRNDV